MNFDLKKPCSDCPFRTDCLRGWLGEDRSQEIADALLSDKSFSCHETAQRDGDTGKPARRSDVSHCAGAAILLEKLERPNQWMRWMERFGFYDRHKMDMSAPVFDDMEEFVEHHTER